MLRSSILALLTIGVPLTAQVAPARPSTSRLQPLLEAEIARFPGVAGIHVKHLGTGEEAGVRADEDFNTASVIKIPVLVLAYQKAGRGELDLDRRLTIGKADVRGGSGIFRYNDVGLTPTVRDRSGISACVISRSRSSRSLDVVSGESVERTHAAIAKFHAPSMSPAPRADTASQ